MSVQKVRRKPCPESGAENERLPFDARVASLIDLGGRYFAALPIAVRKPTETKTHKGSTWFSRRVFSENWLTDGVGPE